MEHLHNDDLKGFDANKNNNDDMCIVVAFNINQTIKYGTIRTQFNR